jgi:hypothetical protein
MALEKDKRVKPTVVSLSDLRKVGNKFSARVQHEAFEEALSMHHSAFNTTDYFEQWMVFNYSPGIRTGFLGRRDNYVIRQRYAAVVRFLQNQEPVTPPLARHYISDEVREAMLSKARRDEARQALKELYAPDEETGMNSAQQYLAFKERQRAQQA